MRPCATQERLPGDGLPLPVLAWRTFAVWPEPVCAMVASLYEPSCET